MREGGSKRRRKCEREREKVEGRGVSQEGA